MAERCLNSAQDLSGLLLLTSARGDVPGLRQLVDSAEAAGRLNVAFLARFLLGDLSESVAFVLYLGDSPAVCGWFACCQGLPMLPLHGAFPARSLLGDLSKGGAAA